MNYEKEVKINRLKIILAVSVSILVIVSAAYTCILWFSCNQIAALRERILVLDSKISKAETDITEAQPVNPDGTDDQNPSDFWNQEPEDGSFQMTGDDARHASARERRSTKQRPRREDRKFRHRSKKIAAANFVLKSREGNYQYVEGRSVIKAPKVAYNGWDVNFFQFESGDRSIANTSETGTILLKKPGNYWISSMVAMKLTQLADCTGNAHVGYAIKTGENTELLSCQQSMPCSPMATATCYSSKVVCFENSTKIRLRVQGHAPGFTLVTTRPEQTNIGVIYLGKAKT